MKRKDLIKEIESAGYSLKRNGGEHDIYAKGSDRIPVPRHKEINENLAKSILKKLGK